MLNLNLAAGRGSVFILMLAAALALPALANAEIFAWRTEDGVYAYADDADKVPARYRKAAVRVGAKRFDDYERLTVTDAKASNAVNTRLSERLAYLRAFNHEAVQAAPNAQGQPTAGPTLTVATGSPHAPTIDVQAVDQAPIVVETVLGKQHNGVVTRSATIVKQGDRTLAVLKGRRNQHNLSEDIVDLDEITE